MCIGNEAGELVIENNTIKSCTVYKYLGFTRQPKEHMKQKLNVELPKLASWQIFTRFYEPTDFMTKKHQVTYL